LEQAGVLILPNQDNSGFELESLAQIGAGKVVQVVPTQSLPQGVAALLRFNATFDLQTNLQRMSQAASQVRTLELRPANHDHHLEGVAIRAGQIMAWLDGRLGGVGAGHEPVISAIFSQLDIELYELVTLYWGQGISARQAQALAGRLGRLYPELEVEVYPGGQPQAHYIISLE
jgi:hypothetical protein